MTAVLLAPVVPAVCRWCDLPVDPHRLAAHTRDVGAAVVCPEGACPVLFEMRRGVTS